MCLGREIHKQKRFASGWEKCPDWRRFLVKNSDDFGLWGFCFHLDSFVDRRQESGRMGIWNFRVRKAEGM